MAKKKEYTLNTKRFLTFVGTLVLIIAVVIVIISLNKKIEINEATDISKMNASKYSNQIAQEYNKDEMKEKFISDFNDIQIAVSIYVISNSTTDSSSFQELILEMQKLLERDNWDKIEYIKPITWNGKWMVDNECKLKFKFGNSKIEPNWINDDDVKNLIIKN